MFNKRILIVGLLMLVMTLSLMMSFSYEEAMAQTPPIDLIVEDAVMGELSAAMPEMLYSFWAQESTRMSVVLDKTAGDMQLNVVVYDQDQTTPLAGASGPAINGLVVEFPSQGQYFVRVGAEPGGTTASYRLMIDADPALPTDAFVLQSYIVSGTGTVCSENAPASFLTPTEDLNVCFVLDLINDPVNVAVRWFNPSGALYLEESFSLTSADNRGPAKLSGIVYQDTAPFAAGFWQAAIIINGELAHTQWVPVQAQ